VRIARQQKTVNPAAYDRELNEFFEARDRLEQTRELEKRKAELLHGKGGRIIYIDTPTENVFIDGVGLVSRDQYEKMRQDKNSPWKFKHLEPDKV